MQILQKQHVPVIDIDLPEIDLPSFPPEFPDLSIDDRAERLRFAIMDDLADFIPIETFDDIALLGVKDHSKPDQFNEFMGDREWLPSTIAMLKQFVEEDTMKRRRL